MRIESSVTSVSWIPSEAVTGLNKAVFGSGFTHYDDPPPDVIDDLDALASADRFRFANHLAAWVQLDGHRITDAGYCGGGRMGSTTVAVGPKRLTYAAVPFPDLRDPVAIDGDRATFVQTVGGHTALPAPRRVSRPPFIAVRAPLVWTTLRLTVHADGRAEHRLVGASAFPRHWVYDEAGTLCAKAGLADFKDWWRRSFGARTPWGDEDSPALVTEAETALERQVATSIMRGAGPPTLRRLPAGELLTVQGERGDEVYLLLNGVVEVEVDGTVLADVGPGAILGERAVIEGGLRRATLRARTAVHVAVVAAGALDHDVLRAISANHRREHGGPTAAGAVRRPTA